MKILTACQWQLKWWSGRDMLVPINTRGANPLTFVLPEEPEILLRLSVKSLLKFRSVSNSWLALISSPEFIKTHLTISADNKELTHHRLMLSFVDYKLIHNTKECSVASLLKGSVMEVPELYYPVKRQPGVVWVSVGSVNGLVCLLNGLTICFVSEKKKLLRWNPSIRKYKKLPDFGTNLRCAGGCTFGFGYDELHDDYKVVGIFYSSWQSIRAALPFDVKIYSLKEDSWSSTHYPHPHGVIFFDTGKFVNGKLHWDTYVERNIVSIDLAGEKWEKIEQPCCVEKKAGLMLGVLGNNLSVIPRSFYLRTYMDVWVMKEYGVKKSWTEMFTVKDPRLSSPIYISNKDEILLIFGQDKFLLYNLKDGSIRSLLFPKLKSGHSGGSLR